MTTIEISEPSKNFQKSTMLSIVHGFHPVEGTSYNETTKPFSTISQILTFLKVTIQAHILEKKYKKIASNKIYKEPPFCILDHL